MEEENLPDLSLCRLVTGQMLLEDKFPLLNINSYINSTAQHHIFSLMVNFNGPLTAPISQALVSGLNYVDSNSPIISLDGHIFYKASIF